MKRAERMQQFTLDESGLLVEARLLIQGDAGVMAANRLALMKPMQRSALDHLWQDKGIVEWTRTFHLHRARIKMPEGPARIRFLISRSRKMDIDNIAASRCLKELIDGLVIAGALAGDDASGVASVRTEAEFGVSPPTVLIRMTWGTSQENGQ